MKSLAVALINALIIARAIMYWIQHQSPEKLRADIAARPNNQLSTLN